MPRNSLVTAARGRFPGPMSRTAPLFLWCVVFAGLLSGGGVEAQDAQQGGSGAAPPASTIAVDQGEASDTAIARRIRDILREIEGLAKVSVTVRAGVVTLRGTIADPTKARQATTLVERVQGVVAVNNEIAADAAVNERLAPAVDRLESRFRAAVDLLPLLAIALLIFAVFVIAGLWLARLRAPWDRIAPNAFVADLVRQVVRLAFMAAGLVLALDIIGATALLGTILGAAGILGLAVGFAVRDTIENYVSSIMLSIRQPFRPNDHVLIEGQEGHIIRLTSRATILMTLDGNHVRIPNATVFKGIVVNYTRNPDRRFDFTLGVDADASLKEAVELGLSVLSDLAFVLKDPEPNGWILEVGDSNVVLWFSGWIDQRTTDFAKARSEALRLTKRAIEEAGIGLPEPIYRLRIDDSTGKAPVAAKAPAVKAKQASEPRPATAESPVVGDASKESAVEEKVAAERAETRERDLLDPAAPPE